MAKIRSTVSFDENIVSEIDLIAEKWYSDRSNTIKRIFLEWKELRAATATTPTEQPRVVTINGVTYTQIDMPEAA